MASTTKEGDQPSNKCVPCSSLDKSALLSREEVEKQLKSTPSLALWKQEMQPSKDDDGDEIPTLCCRFTAKSFQAAMDALNDMGVIAEREQHHPDFHLTNYREVQIDIFTHKLNGITQNDLTLASSIFDEVKVVYSPKWLKNNPEALSSSKEQ